MKAYRYTMGSTLDELALVDLPDPIAGPGQVLLRMRAASLNYRDLLVVQGRYPRGQLDVISPLSDGCGEVVAVGEGVDRFAVGDSAIPLFFQSWLRGPMLDSDGESALGGSLDGVAAQYRVFDADKVIRAPRNLNFAQAATLPCAALTAWNGLHGPRPLVAGETLLTLGTGGVSTFALQFAHAAGARVIVTSSSDEKLAKARALGADCTINYREHPEWSAKVREFTNGRGADHVIETGGGGTMLESVRSTARNGWIHVIGLVAPGQIDPVHVLLAGVTLRGTEVGSREMFEAMNRSIEKSRIEPLVDRVFEFEELPAALRYLEQASHFGKVVIRI
ncbi:zinc-dependent alcohol dehydrogenase family protein [Novosphingobium lentum]|uniref:zinc-dependent alcohol dehydrogenase family protein n=1 Tax=Novosphingobium lentum TaxID=145287 RepID=UPI00082EA0A3|nr:NAD(P)-dependent alcohol dehydrogenase [Novosphingobium lentum]